MTEDELQFVTFIHQHYGLTGTIMSAELAEQDLGIPVSDYERLMARKDITDALDERGVIPPVGTYDTKPLKLADWQVKVRENSLTPEQLLVANTMLDLVDTRSQKKKLQDLNVTTGKYNTWLKDPVFSTYLRDRAESMLGENSHEAHLALIDSVRSGNPKAIELYYELTGRHTRVSASSANAAATQMDIKNIIVGIIEIINDEVDDPQIARRIADRFGTLMTARTIAGELIDGSHSTNPNGNTGPASIPLPAVAKARELTPNLQKLMEAGNGYD